MIGSNNTRMSLLALLEFIVGGIVVLGGAALVYFSTDVTGMSLGVVHATLGLMAFPAGYLLLTGKAGARSLTLGVNSAIIAFSTVSELILSMTGSLPTGPYIDSIVGTIVAVVIAAAIMFQLMSPRPRSQQATTASSAGQGTLSRTGKNERRAL
jgi:hypothetical protein